jgi:hypothetical protein
VQFSFHGLFFVELSTKIIDRRVVRSKIRGEVELLTQVLFEIALPLLTQLHSAYIRDE